MTRIAFSLAMGLAVLGFMDRGATPTRAQAPAGTVVYQTVLPGPPVVNYGERYKVRYRPRRVIIKERPYAYVTPTAPVVRETRFIQSAPIVEQRIIQPAPIVEGRVIQSTPIIQSSPVIRTQYYGPYPY